MHDIHAIIPALATFAKHLFTPPAALLARLLRDRRQYFRSAPRTLMARQLIDNFTPATPPPTKYIYELTFSGRKRRDDAAAGRRLSRRRIMDSPPIAFMRELLFTFHALARIDMKFLD